MVTRVAVYGMADWPPLAAYAGALREAGYDVTYRRHDDFRWGGETFDAAVVYGFRGHSNLIVESFQERGAKAIVLDHGFMRRVHGIDDFKTGHFYVGPDRLGWVCDNAPSPERFAKLKIKVADDRENKLERVLICGQMPFDASHRQSDKELQATYLNLAKQLMEAGFKEVTYRRHPRGGVDLPGVAMDPHDSLDEALQAADVVATINSNAGLDAIIAGTPAITVGASHYSQLAYRWPVRREVIKRPSTEKITAFLERLAWSQWTLAEIAAGAPHRFLKEQGYFP